MDLLGDLGAADQLTSTRAENKVLKEKVKDLEQKCKFLTVENETLKAEVEMYRQDHGTGRTSLDGIDKGNSNRNAKEEPAQDLNHFVKSGDGNYAKSKETLLDKMHGMANPSCCSLSNDDSILGTGGADRNVALLQWGPALNGQDVMSKVVYVPCNAPVIALDFARKSRSPFCVAGCMDGSVHIFKIDTYEGLKATEIAEGTIKHTKYVRSVTWLSNEHTFATSSADGCVQIHKIIWNGLDDNIQLEKVEELNLSAPVESMCFHKSFLVCYVRGTPFLSYFDMSKNFELTKQNLNRGPGYASGFDHVSFCVMDIAPRGEYLALATDTSRNIIIEFDTGKQIRNLYGHQNDGFSQPKIGWSQNGQYIYGNTQDASELVVWDVSSGSIVDRLGGHGNNIRDLYSSTVTDTVVTTSFDKKTFIWLPIMQG